MLVKIAQKFIYILPILGIIAFTCLVLYGYSIGVFTSVHSLQVFMKQFGEYAIFMFIILQILQVIVPILPGGISTVVGMLLFGTISGLIYSYLGLVIGDILAYWLARYYGQDFARLILTKKKFAQFTNQIGKPEKTIKKLLIITLLIPFAPDDLVCLIAGLTDFPFKEYLKVLLLFKLWSVATYGCILLYLFEKAISL